MISFPAAHLGTVLLAMRRERAVLCFISLRKHCTVAEVQSHALSTHFTIAQLE